MSNPTKTIENLHDSHYSCLEKMWIPVFVHLGPITRQGGWLKAYISSRYLGFDISCARQARDELTTADLFVRCNNLRQLLVCCASVNSCSYELFAHATADRELGLFQNLRLVSDGIWIELSLVKMCSLNE